MKREEIKDEKMRILLDTNNLVSAAIAKGKSRNLLLKALANEFELISSTELLNELEDVISRSKFKLSSFEEYKFFNTLRKTVKLVKVKADFKIVKEDPDDDNVLNTAYDGKADFIVTGDLDLLRLKEFEGIKIVTASEMLKILERKD